jgi:hypothetical protein
VQTIHESEMALFHEGTLSCARMVLDMADIVLEIGIYQQPGSPFHRLRS